MAISYTIAQHATGYPTKLCGGKHIYNVKITTAAGIDNGNFIGRGDYVSLDLYKEGTASSFAGVIREKAANGNYYVEVTADTDALFVYTVPVNAETFTKAFESEAAFYNAQGDVARCYELAKGDIVEVSAAGFTATPVVGKTVSLSGVKLAIAA